MEKNAVDFIVLLPLKNPPFEGISFYSKRRIHTQTISQFHILLGGGIY